MMHQVNRQAGHVSTALMRSAVIGCLVIALTCILLIAPAGAEERFAVSSKVANVRSGPGRNFPVIWKVERYFPVAVQEKKGNWYRFTDYEGDEGWLHKSLLTKNVETVVTKAVKCNIRSGPSTSNSKVFVVDDGVPFKVISRNGNWVQVEHADGDRGWIHQNLVW